jgi:hypothetical protein
MKKLRTIVFLSIFFSGNLISQNYFDVSGGMQTLQQTEWNKTIQTYNFNRIWLKEQMPDLRNASNVSIGYSGVLASGLFFSPSLSFSSFRSSATNGEYRSMVRLRWLSVPLCLDIFPLEFGKDSVSSSVRPFLRVGGGASLLMPRVLINDELVTVGDELYQPLVWPFFYTAGLGIRYNLNRSIGILFTAMYLNYPNIDLEDFSYALNGNNLVGLKNETSVQSMTFQLSCSFRLNGPKTDTEEVGKKKVKFKKRR